MANDTFKGCEIDVYPQNQITVTCYVNNVLNLKSASLQTLENVSNNHVLSLYSFYKEHNWCFSHCPVRKLFGLLKTDKIFEWELMLLR